MGKEVLKGLSRGEAVAYSSKDLYWRLYKWRGPERPVAGKSRGV